MEKGFNLNIRQRIEKKKTKREFLKRFIPADLELKYGQDLKPHKWNFDGELLDKRKMEDVSSKIFFEALDYYNKNSEDSEALKKLEREALQEKRNIAQVIDIELCLDKNLKDNAAKNKWDDYTKILQTMPEAGLSVTEEEAKAGLKGSADKGWWNDYANILQTISEIGLDITKEAEAGLKNSADKGRWSNYASILQTMSEAGLSVTEEEARVGLKGSADKGLWDSYARILQTMSEAGLGITEEEARAGLKGSADKDWWSDYASILQTMSKVGLDITKEAEAGLKNSADKGRWSNYASILQTMPEAGLSVTEEGARAGLKGSADKGWWSNYAKILQIMSEAGLSVTEEEARVGLKGSADKGWWSDYAKILQIMSEAGLSVTEEARRGLSSSVNEDRWDSYASILKTMSEAGLDITKEARAGLKGSANDGWWNGYASILQVMSKVGLDITEEEARVGLKGSADNGWWSDYAKILQVMQKANILNFNNPTAKSIKSYIKEQREEDQSFLQESIRLSLFNNKSLEDINKKNGIYPTYQSLVSLGVSVNEGIQEESKKVREPEAFFAANSITIAQMLSLESPLILGLIKEHINEGLPKFNGYLELYKNIFDQTRNRELIQAALDNNSFSHPHELGTFLEIVNAYQKSDKIETLSQLVAENSPNLNEQASQQLLAFIAEEVGVSEDEIKTKREDWKTEYLPNLVSNDQMLESRGMDNARELYRSLLKASFKNEFDNFLFDTNQDDEVGQDVALHNSKVKEIFTDNGIDFAKWLKYEATQDFLVSTEVEIDRKEHYQSILSARVTDVINALAPLKDKLSSREYQPLLHILEGKDKKGLNSSNQLQEQFNNLKERINNLQNKEEYSNFPEWPTVYEYLGHLEEAVVDMNKPNFKETEQRERGFRVKLWDRDPKKDLFQGNYSQCCIAVGVKDAPVGGGLTTHDPSTVMQYLADTGINVIEILEEGKRDPIGNTWIFVSKNSDGEPILVLDNIELNNNYTKDPHINNSLRDNLFQFAKDYAKEVGLAGAGLGLVGTNDIDWKNWSKDNRMRVPQVDTISGYLSKYTANIANRSGRYYLEAFNHQELGKIWDQREDKKTPEKKESLTQEGLVITYDLERGVQEEYPNTETGFATLTAQHNSSLEAMAQQIEEIEDSIFGDKGLNEDIEDILNNMSQARAISFLFTEKNKAVGYLSAYSANLLEVPDHNYDKDEATLYVDSIAGKVDPFRTLNQLKEKAKKLGYKKISLHGINPRLNTALKRSGFIVKEEIPNWYGQPAEYLELDLEE
ncbi:MAG: hypothetical protein ACOX0C_02750 [Patescibacteria group bacterium]|jgi:hypothetical protein